MHAASVKEYLDVASLLFKNGADLNSQHCGQGPTYRTSQGGQRVIVESPLETAQLLMNSGANVNVLDDEGETPLYAAARSWYRDIAVESGASLDVRNTYQQTSPLLDCHNGKFDVSRFLIDRGSEINCRDNEGLITLHAASQYGHVEASQLLLDCGSDVNAHDTEFWTPPHFASRYGYLDLTRLLIDHGVDVNAKAADRWTPINRVKRWAHGHHKVTG